MTFDRSKLGDQVAQLARYGRLTFAVLCAERLRACCWAFCRDQSWDMSKYYEGCELLFKHLTSSLTIDQVQMQEIVAALEEQVPNSDEFGDPLAVQAQSGALALLYAFDVFAT